MHRSMVIGPLVVAVTLIAGGLYLRTDPAMSTLGTLFVVVGAIAVLGNGALLVLTRNR